MDPARCGFYFDLGHPTVVGGTHGPISLQQEFTIAGAADDQGIAVSRAAIPRVMESAKENLEYLRSLIRESYQQERLEAAGGDCAIEFRNQPEELSQSRVGDFSVASNIGSSLRFSAPKNF